MTFIDRSYQDIVRDVLTAMTQGITREVHHVAYDAGARPVVVPDIVLRRRPVRRVSAIEGFIDTGVSGPNLEPCRFTPNDYELIGSAEDPGDLSTLRFAPFGRRPAPDTDLFVNYYPRHTDPTVLTDLNVGSVARTLVESVSRELALLYAQLNLAYDSAFLETAEGSSLDRVVALLGLRRFRAGRPVGTVRFTRRPASPGGITIPAGTPITDAEDKIRYETIETHSMLAGESTAEVRVRGAGAATPAVEAGVLVVIQRSIAGIDTVANDRPTTRATQDETDPELRARAGSALLAGNKGTADALRFGLLQLPDVRDVKLLEMPNGVPGEIRIDVSLAEPSPSGLPAQVLARIEELRAAGIRVVASAAQSVSIQARVDLVLAGSHLPAVEIEQVHQQVRGRLAAAVRRAGVGQKVRVGPIVASILQDERVLDATLTLGRQGSPGAAGADFEPPGGSSAQLAEEDVSFGPDAFDQAPEAGARAVIEVRAVIAATPHSGQSIDAVKGQIQSRLEQLFAAAAAGTSVAMPLLLTSLRDDAKYQIDPLRTVVTLSGQAQFVQISQGGAAYTVQPGQQFSVLEVEVTA